MLKMITVPVEALKRTIVQRPMLITVVVSLMTLAFLPGALKIKVNDDLKASIPKESPIQQAMAHLEDTFGGSETIVLALYVPQGQTVFDVEPLTVVRDLVERIESTPGIMRVRALTNVDYPDRDADGSMYIHAMVEEAPADASAAALIRAHAESDPMLSRAFLSDDRTVFAVYVDARKQAPDDQVLGALGALTDQLPAGYRVEYGGLPVLRHYTNLAVKHDMRTLIPLCFLVLSLVLWWSLRSISGVLLTISVVGFSILPPAGLMGYFGIEMTAGNNMFPTLILGTACAESVHVLLGFLGALRSGKTKREAVEHILHELFVPIFVTVLTTVIGFLTLVTSEIPPVRSLGLMVAIGCSWSWLLSGILLPAVFMLLPTPKNLGQDEHHLELGFPAVQWMATKHPKISAIMLFVPLFAVSVYFIPQVELEPRFEANFPAGNPVREASLNFDKNFGGISTYEVVFQADPRDASLLRAVYALEHDLAAMPHVGGTDSVAQMVARVNERLNGDDPAYRAIPEQGEMVSQALLLTSMQGDPNVFQRFVKTDFSEFRLTIRLSSMPERELQQTLGQIEAMLAKHIPPGTKYIVTGRALFDQELATLMSQSTLSSTFWSMLICLVLCWVFIRSFVAGVLSMVPLGVSILTVFSVMGMLDIGLSVSSAVLLSVVIGVGVDYSIHVLSRWNLEHKRTEHLAHNPVERFDVILAATHTECGVSILSNALAVALGLGVLIFSGFAPIQNLGILTATAMASTAFTALVILPLIKRALYRAR